MKKLLSVVLSLCLLLSAFSGFAAAENAAVEINLYGIGDFGGGLDDSGKPSGNPGGARIVGKMKELTAQAANPIVVAGGTSYTGSAISETNHGELVNAMYKAMGVVYAAVGNHDFDWSDVNTRDAVFGGWQEQGGFKFLNANVYWTAGDKARERVFTPYEIKEIAGVKVGFFSVIDEGNMSAISNVNKEGIEMRSSLEEAVTAVKALREEGAQVVIALAHVYGAQDAPYTVEQPISSSLADLIAACEEAGGIDAVFGSQTTSPMCGMVGKTAVVKAQNFGKLIGHLKIAVAADGTVSAEPELIPLTQIVANEQNLFGSDETTRESLPVDEEFLAVYNTYNDALTILMDAPRGYSDVDMSFEPDDLKFAYQKWYLRNNLYYLNNVYGEHVDAYFHQKGGIRNIGSEVIKAGDTISLRTLYASAPFENYIYTFSMKGADIKSLLFGSGKYGEYTSLLQYGFDVVYESGDPYEANGPIASITINGEPVDDEKVYRLATNSFLYPGPGDGIDLDAGFDATHTNVLNRTALLKSILHQSANLTGLDVPGLEPAFSPTVYEYTATAAQPLSYSVNGTASVASEEVDGKLLITVTSPYEDPYTEPGTVQNVYTITLAGDTKADTYTTASATKTVLEGDALKAAEEVLMAKSSLLSTAEEVAAEGYVAKEGTGTAQIMSINPDGSVGLSTISEWQYTDGKAKVKLTQGQNALNLAKVGATGTLLVKGDGPVYLLHLTCTDFEVLEYSEETAGKFDQYYSGAANALNEYDIVFDVGAIEQTFALMF